MNGLWLAANKESFVRDLVRDFCHVYAAVAGQHARFTASGAISHAMLRELLGRDMRKGVFWRLKDTAHHLFRTPHPRAGGESRFPLRRSPGDVPPDDMACRNGVESLLDWCIGFAFHECVKLKEDAFQRQHYANRLTQMRGQFGERREMLENLAPLLLQTRESIQREMARILHVLDAAKNLLLLYLRGHGDNGLLARFLATEEALARGVFGRVWEDLLESLYERRPHEPYLSAARACLDSGRPQQALHALDTLTRRAAAERAAWTEEAALLRRRAETFDAPDPGANSG